MRKKIFLLLLIVMASVSALHAADKQTKEMTPKEFEASLKYQKGDIALPGGIATLKIPPAFRYIGPKDTERVLVEAWGNPEGAGTLGMVLPADISPVSPKSWGVVITYNEDGYVSDKDAESIDYGKLLTEMKEGLAEDNKERQKSGLNPIELVGWAQPPHYDKSTHKIYWAKEIKFDNGPENTLNYNVRILGRKGVLVLNAVAGMTGLNDIEKKMKDVIAFTDFNPGFKYTDFNSGTDKTASYGIAALVAGGVAAKTGLLTKLVGLLVAAKKLVVLGFMAIVAFFSRLFKKKEE